jgi:hypothetical protein
MTPPINKLMSDMRRHRLIVEQFELLRMLLETREEALMGTYLGRLAKMVENRDLAPGDYHVLENKWPTMRLELNLRDEPDRFTQAIIPRNREERCEFIARLMFYVIWDADPDPKKSHVQWLLNKWCSKNHQQFPPKLEDLPDITAALELYMEVKKKKETREKLAPEEIDINRFKTVNGFLDRMREFRTVEGQIVTQEEEQAALSQSTVLLDDSEYRIVIPKTMEASNFFGRGTDWCTAYQGDRSNNMFDYYNDRGPLVIVIHKLSGKRWQFHRESRSYMDEHDRGINTDLWIKEHPRATAALEKMFPSVTYEKITGLDEVVACINKEHKVGFISSPSTIDYAIGNDDAITDGGIFTEREKHLEVSLNPDYTIKNFRAQTFIAHGIARYATAMLLRELGARGDHPGLMKCGLAYDERGDYVNLSVAQAPKATTAEGQALFEKTFGDMTLLAVTAHATVMATVEITPRRRRTPRVEYNAAIRSHLVVPYLLELPTGTELVNSGIETLPMDKELAAKHPNWYRMVDKAKLLGADHPVVRQRLEADIQLDRGDKEVPVILDTEDEVIFARYDKPNFYSMIASQNAQRAIDIVDETGWETNQSSTDDIEEMADLIHEKKPDLAQKLIAWANLDDYLGEVNLLEKRDDDKALKLRELLGNAHEDGYRISAESEAYDALLASLQSTSFRYQYWQKKGDEFVKFDRLPFLVDSDEAIYVSMNTIGFISEVYTYDEYVNYSPDWGHSVFTVEEPRNGWGSLTGLDKDAAIDSFETLIWEAGIIDDEGEEDE